MALPVAFFCVAILLFGAGFHFYWGLGGRVGYEASIPRRQNGERLFSPPNWGAHLVGVVLVISCWLVLAFIQFISSPMPHSWVHFLVTCMAVGFIVRALWASPYGGLFKSVRNSEFARYDTVLYSPLFLILGAGLLYALHQT